MESQLSKSVQGLASISADYSHIDSDCLLVHLDSELSRHFRDLDLARSCVEGMLCFLHTKGVVEVEYNSDRFVVSEPALIVASQGTLFHIDSPDWAEVDAYVLVQSLDFIQEVNISFSAISGQAFISKPSHVLLLRDRELPTLLRYFKLMHMVMTDNFNSQLTRHMMSNMMAAFFYQTVAFLYKRLDVVDQDKPGCTATTTCMSS